MNANLGHSCKSFAIVAALLALAAAAAARADEPFRFPDARDAPPKDWTGPVFRLRQDFPTELPAPEAYPWKKFDPRTQWRQYLQSVFWYCCEGNVEIDWDVQQHANVLGARQWYHAPWMHWGRNGREFVHGLTHERVAVPGDLAMTQTSQFQNWAVSIYNAPGGYTIGQVWKDPMHPNGAAAKFPDGTVSIKLLFTEASVEEVPYLAGSKEWPAYIYRSVVMPTNPRTPRAVKTVRLAQIDVAVKDDRLKEWTGWAFGTFAYNGKNQGKTVWERMEPVGLMWGNDEGLTVAAARQGSVPKECIINHSPDLPFQHLGWAGRLNGPVDNPVSSCLSCHSTAQVSVDGRKRGVSAIPTGLPDSPQWQKYFRNLPSGKPFSEPESDWQSLDYSMQLSTGILNFREWKAEQGSLGGAIVRAPKPERKKSDEATKDPPPAAASRSDMDSKRR